MRGLNFVTLPTTILAQVDASVGGKTAIDHPKAKNLIGAFHQPRLVIVDPAVVRTLPDREFRSGLAEIVKHGIVLERAYFDEVERDRDRLLGRDLPVLERIIGGSCRLKAAVIERDPEEKSDLRFALNYGHTVGHALEAATGFTRWTHGEAVALGIVAEARLARRLEARRRRHGGAAGASAGLPRPAGARRGRWTSTPCWARSPTTRRRATAACPSCWRPGWASSRSSATCPRTTCAPSCTSSPARPAARWSTSGVSSTRSGGTRSAWRATPTPWPSRSSPISTARRAGPGEAVATCREGLRRWPHYTTARLILAKTLLAEGQHEAALTEIAAILQTSPKDVQCHASGR